VFLLLLALGLGGIVQKLHLTTDLGQFLPQSAVAEQQMVLDELREGASARLVMLALSGETEPVLADLSRGLMMALEQSGRFVRVVNGKESLSEEEQARWFRYRYLLADGPMDFSSPALKQAFSVRLQELNSPLAPFTKQYLAADPSAAYRYWLKQWQGERIPHTAHGVWFSPDGRALLYGETRAAGFDIDAQADNIAFIREAFAALSGRGDAQLAVSGAGAIAVASRETIRSETQWLSMAAGLAVALILLWVYRSPRLWLLSTLPLVSAVVAALAVTTLVFGTVHGITLAFGITLLGVAIDYPIHLFSHLQPGIAPSESLRRIWPTLRLGVVSTAVGYLAMIATGFDGLVQLGVFTIAGLFAAVAVTRWVVPQGLPEVWRGGSFALGRTVWGGYPLPWRFAAVLFVLAASLGVLVLSDRPLWENDVAALSPVPESVRQQDRQLREAMAVSDLNHLLLIRGETPQAVLQREEALAAALGGLRQGGDIDGFHMAAQWLPSIEKQAQRQARLPDAPSLHRAVAEAQQGLPFREGVFTPFTEQVEESRHLPLITPQAVQGTLLGTRIAPLLFQRDGFWWGVVRLSGVRDAQRLATWADRQLSPGMYYLNLKAETNRMVNGFRDAALDHLGWGALLIALLLWWGLGTPRRVLQVLLPVAAAIAASVAALHLLGERLTLFHLTSLLLVLGIGIDYSLFFSRPDPTSERLRTAHALLVCAISTLTVFGILALSSLPVLHAIGLTVFFGVLGSYSMAWLSAASLDAAAASHSG
jgi:predicted exporter